MSGSVHEVLREVGLLKHGENPPAVPLAGGVSSDIWRVDLASGPVCVKRALERLRVAQVWEAPLSRNRYEYEWLRIAGETVPHAAPAILAQADGAFVMEFLDPARYPVWKELLRRGSADRGFAGQVGATLAAIHRATTATAALFPTDEIFYAIRLEPYLVATAARHPDLEPRLTQLVQTTANTRVCLVHGDVSPKNILVGPHGPVFLDAECAWYGDPAFDLAFCLNHLLLKCLWVRDASAAFLDCFDALAGAYLKGIAFAAVEARAAALLPGLLLARVDGKSPVEYLDGSNRAHVRAVARRLLLQPVPDLSLVKKAWQESLT